MKLRPQKNGFSSVDFLVVLATIGIFGVIISTSTYPPRSRPPRIACLNNLKQVTIALNMLSSDNGDKFPSLSAADPAWHAFDQLAPYIGHWSKILVCREDEKENGRKAAANFYSPPGDASFSHPKFRNAALSYFYGMDASFKKPDMFLAGDRSISTDTAIRSGLLTVATNSQLQWAEGIHKGGGNIGFVDGSARYLSTPGLNQLVRTGTNGTQRLLLP